jgi:FtsP/CotA-like multicopper oxidase with cupredoxin domain
MDRRQFLALGSGMTAATLLSQCVVRGDRSTSTGKVNRPAVPSPAVLRSQEGLLDADLTAQWSQIQVGDRPQRLMTYNGIFPGPRFEVQPGDTVRLRFHSRLGEPTNLHFHGLHIPPTGQADNVFVEVPSGESFTYEFQIPRDHPGLTAWYHPHLHHASAHQVGNGLAGLFVVRGPLDDWADQEDIGEQFVVLQDVTPSQDRALSHMAMMLGREGPVITLNGQVRPTLRLPQTGLLRLKLLNASPSRFYRLRIADHPWTLLATDGGAIAAPTELQELLLVPGERVEVLIRSNGSPQRYPLQLLPYDRGTFHMMGGMGGMGRGSMGGMMEGMGHSGMGMSGVQNPGQSQVLAWLEDSGASRAPKLFSQLATLETLPEPATVRQFVLDHGMTPTGPGFTINRDAYAPDVINTRVRLNTIEDWEILNAGSMDHPFHVHINPFQEISRDGQPVALRAWKDVTLVRAGEQLRLRIRFSDFPGRTVYHCHILDHEDHGMMGNLDIQAPASAT